MKFKSLLIYCLVIAVGIGILSCEKKDNDNSNYNPINAGNVILDFNGDFLGQYSKITLNKASGIKETTLVNSYNFSIIGSYPKYNLYKSIHSVMPLTANGAGISSFGGTGVFFGSSYFGDLQGNLITINETGENDNFVWTGQIIASRP